MSRPHPEVVATVDEFVRQLDVAEAGEPGTSSYALILDAWERYRAATALLDAAVRNPFAPGAAAMLAAAREVMYGLDAWKLGGWLSHVGEAVGRHRP